MYTIDYRTDPNCRCGHVSSTVPDTLAVGADIEIRTVYSAPEEGLRAGSRIRITMPSGSNPIRRNCDSIPGYLQVKADAKCNEKVHTDLSFSITLEEALKPHGKVEFIYNPKGDQEKKVVSRICYKDPVELAVDVMPAGEEKYTRIYRKECRYIPGKAVRIFIKVPSIVYEGENFDLEMNVRDEYDNIAEGFTGEVRLYGNREVLDFPERVIFFREDGGNKLIPGICRFKTGRKQESSEETLLSEQKGYNLVCSAEELANCQKISAICGEIKGQSNYVLLSEPGTPRVYWGEVHVHTRDLSDGIGTVNDAFYYMKEVSKFDFGGLGDHSFQGAHGFLPETPGRDVHIPKREWRNLIQRCRQETTEGKFVAIPGYEWSGRVEYDEVTPGWTSHVISDKNIIFGDYNTDNPIVYQCIKPLDGTVTEEDRATIPGELYEKLNKSNCMAISHSTSSDPMGTDFNHVDTSFEPVVEIYSTHGANEYYGNPRPLYSIYQEGFVQHALAIGKKLGFIAGSDDHYTHPGSSKVSRLDYDTMAYLRYRPGITAVMSAELSLQGVFSSLKQRMCYATTGERILIQFTLGGQNAMGRILKLDTQPVFHCLAAGTARIEKIELIRNNRVLYCWVGSYETEKFAYRDKDIQPGESYYYIRVTQSDGEMAWSSPVWVDFNKEA